MSRPVSVLAWLTLLCAPSAWAADCAPGPRTLDLPSGRAQLVLPPTARPGQSLPLVIGLHPSGGSGRSFDEDTGLVAAAGRKGFAVLLADGALRTDDGTGHYWNIPGVPLVSGAPVPAGTRDDVRFLADAIDAATKDACIDPRRVFATGFSGGARMASLVGCRLADRVAAIAPVAGLRAGRGVGPSFAEPDPEDCRPAKPVRVLAIHGTDDATNPYTGGGGIRWGYTVERAAERWARLDGCAGPARSERLAPTVTRIEYGSCGASGGVLLYRIDAPAAAGGGHVWPGGRNARGAPLDATTVVLDFFSQPLR